MTAPARPFGWTSPTPPMATVSRSTQTEPMEGWVNKEKHKIFQIKKGETSDCDGVSKWTCAGDVPWPGYDVGSIWNKIQDKNSTHCDKLYLKKINVDFSLITEQLHVQQAIQESWSKDYYPWPLVSCHINFTLEFLMLFSFFPMPEEYGMDLAPNTASSIAVQLNRVSFFPGSLFLQMLSDPSPAWSI